MKKIIFTFTLLIIAFTTKAQNFTIDQLLELKKIKVYKNPNREAEIESSMSSNGWELIEKEKPTLSNFTGTYKYKNSNNKLAEAPSIEYIYNLNYHYSRVSLKSISSDDKLNEYLSKITELGAKLIASQKDEELIKFTFVKDNVVFIVRKTSVEWVFGYEVFRSLLIISKDDYIKNFKDEN